MKRIDLIISDWLMPNMDGVELFNSIKSNPGFSEIPFILLTSVREKEQVVKAAGSGIRHYVIKPVDPNSLRDKILSCLG
jgi:two-component system, chemotaxis family, chemotaxis protein CheY